MAEPVTLAELRWQLKDPSDSDDDLNRLIADAREYVEGETGLVLTAPRTVVETRRFFGPWIDLRAWPIISINSISYLDSSYVPQILDASLWIAGTAVRPVRIASRGNIWPTIAAAPAAVTISVTAGFASPDAVPNRAKRAILMLAAHYYINREAAAVGPSAGAVTVPLGVSELLSGLTLKTV